MKVKNIICQIIVIMSLFFISCASTGFEGKAVFAGRVCDESGNPVPNYHVRLGKAYSGMTDISGAFFIPQVKAGEYHLTGGGKNWQEIEETVVFDDRKKFFYLSVKPLADLFVEIESAMAEGDFESAALLLEGEKEFNGSHKEYVLFKEIISYAKNPSDEQKNKIHALIEKL